MQIKTLNIFIFKLATQNMHYTRIFVKLQNNKEKVKDILF